MAFLLFILGAVLLVTGVSVLFESNFGIKGPIVTKFEYLGKAVLKVLFGHGQIKYPWAQYALGLFIILGSIGFLYCGYLLMLPN